MTKRYAVFLGAILAVITNAAFAQSVVPRSYIISLDRAAFGGDDYEKNPREMVLDLEQQGERWGPVFGLSRSYNMNTHGGIVRAATINGNAIELKVDTLVRSDGSVHEARGSYTISLTRNGDAVTGTFSGTFKGKDVRGKAFGTARDLTPAKGFVPLAPREHPRLLFRKADLPALKAKAETPFGKAALARMNGTTLGRGMLYQLTGDKNHADVAMQMVKAIIGEGGKDYIEDSPFTPSRPVGTRLEHVAFAYDLCFEAWPEDFKTRVRKWVLIQAHQAYFTPSKLPGNWHVQSNHVGTVFAGLATCGLVMFDEPGKEDPGTPLPYEDEQPKIVITPDDSGGVDALKGFFKKAQSGGKPAVPQIDLGAVDPGMHRLLRVSRFYMYQLFRESVGTGGFQAEVGGYSVDTTDGPNRYAPAYRRVFGYDLSPYNDIAYYVPRKVFAAGQDINGTGHIGNDYFAALFPMIPPQWQPEMLTAWRQHQKVTNDASLVNVLDNDPVHAFVNYPLDMKPAPLGTSMPLVWEAPDFGYYAFRNSWKDDAFITQVFLKARPVNGWNGQNAGTFRIKGLGQIWASGSTNRQRTRIEESVVWLPEDDVNEGGSSQVTFLKTEPDGSGVVSIDMNEVYEVDRKFYWSRYGRVRFENPNTPGTSGISGMRSIGVDYSGLSGMPLLFVVVDKLSGGNKKVWLWQTPAPPEECVKTIDNGFEIRSEGATLRGVFATPRPPVIDARTKTKEYIKAAGSGAGKTKFNVTIPSVQVEGGDNFFFVATVGKGEHPPLTVSGEGLNATVTVGKRVIRFDGNKIVFGQAP